MAALLNGVHHPAPPIGGSPVPIEVLIVPGGSPLVGVAYRALQVENGRGRSLSGICCCKKRHLVGLSIMIVGIVMLTLAYTPNKLVSSDVSSSPIYIMSVLGFCAVGFITCRRIEYSDSRGRVMGT